MKVKVLDYKQNARRLFVAFIIRLWFLGSELDPTSSKMKIIFLRKPVYLGGI